MLLNFLIAYIKLLIIGVILINNLEQTQIKDSSYTHEINLIDLFFVIWNKKLLIFSITAIFAILSVMYALSLSNIYRSQALLAPANNSEASSMLGQYSGLASMAGISLGSSEGDKSVEAIERIKSYEFFSTFFLPKILLQDLMAVETWNPGINKINYDKKFFNDDKESWEKKESGKSYMPSSQEAYEKYAKIMNISKDKKTNFVRVSIDHQSPYIAQDWTKIIIQEINQSMRNEDKDRSVKSLNFLNEQLLKVNYEEIKLAISSLQQEQMKSLMLIESNKDYIFKVLNSPIAPEKKFAPQRPIIAVTGTLLGFIISLAYVLITYFRRIFQQKA